MCCFILSALNLRNYEPSFDEITLLNNFEHTVSQEIIEQNALLYVAGYVAHRFRNQYSYLATPTKNLPNISDDWISCFSKGNCLYPSPSFQKTAQIMNEEFNKFHGDLFSRESKIFDKLTNIVLEKLNNNFPKQVIACLVRTRTYIRLRAKNKEIVLNDFAKKLDKKMYKLSNQKKHCTYMYV